MKRRNNYKIEYYLSIKQYFTFATTWMDPEVYFSSSMRQTKRSNT